MTPAQCGQAAVIAALYYRAGALECLAENRKERKQLDLADFYKESAWAHWLAATTAHARLKEGMTP